jgi:tetratricopeptide (TPR) repeat protein
MATGRETLSFNGHADEVLSLTFSLDGTQLTTASSDGTLKVWDARSWTPARAIEREARGLLEYLLTRPLCHADVRAYLRSSPTVRPPVRETALALLERYREETDPERYQRGAWVIVRQSHLNRFQYRFAASQAETACRLAPSQNAYRTTLGAARYRTGQYHEALAALKQAEALDPSAPANLAFLAMTHHRIGQTDQARMALAHLRDAMQRSLPKRPPEALAFLREAEPLIQSKPVSPGR